jgi:hypothetical protein
MLHQQRPICFHPCGLLTHNPVAVRAAPSSPRVTARGMRASPQRVAVAAEPSTGGAPVQNTGQRRGETGATAVAGALAGAGAYGETVSQSSDWSARRLRWCRYWIAPPLRVGAPAGSPPRGARFPARHPPRLHGSGAMYNALPRLAHGRSRRCHPGPPCRRLRAAAPTAACGRVVRWSGSYDPLHRRPRLRHCAHRRGDASAASGPP